MESLMKGLLRLFSFDDKFSFKTTFIELLSSLLFITLAQLADLHLFANNDQYSELIKSPLSLYAGTALILVFHYKYSAFLAILISPIIFWLANSLNINTDLIVNSESNTVNTLPFLLINGFAVSVQSMAIYLSFISTVRKGNPLKNSRTLIFYISISTIITAIITLLVNINYSNSIFNESLTLDLYFKTFLANLTSLLVIPPVYFSLLNHSNQTRQNTHPLEWFLWFSATVLTGYLSIRSQHSFLLLAIPLLMWVATRFNQLTCCFSICLSSLLLANDFALNNLSNSLSLMPTYTPNTLWLMLILITLYFSVLRTDRRRIETTLEEKVSQRTRDLMLANQELRDEVYNREQAEKSLLNSSQRFKALFETAGIPIIVLDSKFCVKQWNTAAELQFSYTREKVVGRNFIDMFISSTAQDETAWKFTKVLESGMNKENLENIITSQDGQQHTMLWNMNRFSDQSNPSQKNQLLMIGQNISDIRDTQNQLHYLAHFDALTDTANRRLFEDRCEQAIQSSLRHKNQIALIELDIDHFKHINDSLGHDVGDLFLQVLSERLKESVRKEDTVARLGGDEFAILLANVSGSEGAEIVARNILENITQPIIIKGNELLVTSSIGITLCPDDSTQYTELLKNADMAMYRAKKAGRNNIQFYSPEMNEEMKRQLAIEQEIRTAFKEKQFILHYQPIIDMETGEVLALEALLRWQHPEKGLIKPDYFLDIAEQSGQLHHIGQWVLRNACLQGIEIQKWSLHPLQLALNLSNRQFNHPSLVKLIEEITLETKFNPHNLILEMSETTITSNMEASFSTLTKLHELGVSLTIDSFGTGLSSLRQLKQIPIDIIKIDRTFVKGIPQDESDMAITETLLVIANQMDLKTFATGVESVDQEAFLKINGCRYAQGYLYSAPLSFEQLPVLFENIKSGKALSQGEQIFLPLEEKSS